jgi:hypothetical protein
MWRVATVAKALGKESLVNGGMRLEETSIAVFNIMVTFSCKEEDIYANCN